jgi:endonuclease/exonuclease/phosphatase family metal-dependent hydrolase
MGRPVQAALQPQHPTNFVPREDLMSRCVQIGMRGMGAAALLIMSTFVAPAAAQTTVVLDSPSEVSDSFIRAGDYARTIHNNGVLTTKANNNPDYVRRALLKFDTENHIPARSRIQSATMTVTLARSESSTRTISAYRIANSFDEWAATWHRRKESGANWSNAGGDLGSRYATASVGTSRGTRVSFNVTSLVQSTVNGNYGSRYTRIALVDGGSSSASSLKEFYSSEASDAGLRPKLTVVYGSGTAAPDDEDEEEEEEAPAPAPNTSSGSSSTLKVLDWNIHYGIGMDGRYGIDKYVDWIVRLNPDIISLNEVEKNVRGHGDEDQPALFASKLRARTGRTWYYHHANRYGNWGDNGGGNLILSRFPILARSQLAMSGDRSAALATLSVNGRNVNFISTHLANSSEGSSLRASQLRQLLSWARGFAEQRIIAGDFNAGLSNLPYIDADYNDAWREALAIRTADGFDGYATYRNGYQIDFVFRSENATNLRIRSTRVYDARESDGDRVSDHYPVLVTYEVR